MNISAITAPLNAFITCAFIMLFMSKIKLKPEIKCPIIYLVYAVFAFVMGAGGNGLFNLDMSKFDMTMYIYRLVAGVFVCLGLYLYIKRGDLARTLHKLQGREYLDK